MALYLYLVYLFWMAVCQIYGSLFCCQTSQVDKSAGSVCVHVSMCVRAASTISKGCSPTFTILQTLFTRLQDFDLVYLQNSSLEVSVKSLFPLQAAVYAGKRFAETNTVATMVKLRSSSKIHGMLQAPEKKT